MHDSEVRRCRITSRQGQGGRGMAETDALRAPAGRFFVRGEASGRLAGNARAIAAPAYKRLLAAEPYLRRTIPTLILIFLVVIAASRFMSLVTLRDEVERNANAVLALAAGQLAHSVELAASK